MILRLEHATNGIIRLLLALLRRSRMGRTLTAASPSKFSSAYFLFIEIGKEFFKNLSTYTICSLSRIDQLTKRTYPGSEEYGNAKSQVIFMYLPF